MNTIRTANDGRSCAAVRGPQWAMCSMSVEAGELAIFDPSTEAIDFHADADTQFVLGSAAPHAHDLVLGRYSVHTSPATLRAGEQRLKDIQRRLQNEGRL